MALRRKNQEVKRQHVPRLRDKVIADSDFTESSTEDAWDWDGECRIELVDHDANSRDEWVWSNSVAVFHSLQDLPPSVQRELDRHEWIYWPQHGDRSHVLAVQNQLTAERHQAPEGGRLKQSERRGSLASGAKMTEVDVAAIATRRANGDTIKSIAEDLGVSKTAVWNAANGRSWRHVRQAETSL